MNYISVEQYQAALAGHALIKDAARKLAADFADKFAGPYDTIEVTVEGDEITGEIMVELEHSACSCCPSDYYYYEIPISYLWDEQWIEKEEAKREEARKKQEAERIKREAEDKKKREEARFKTYLAMKKEFEGK